MGMGDDQRQTLQNGHAVAATKSFGNVGAGPTSDLLESFGHFRRPIVRGMPVGSD